MNKVLRAYRLPVDVVEGLESIQMGNITDHVVLAIRQYLENQGQAAKPKKPKKEDSADYTDTDDLIDLINEVSGRKFRHTKQNREGIHARLQEYSFEECQRVVNCMWSRWQGDQKMEQYFNPTTLFRPANFEKYLNAGFKPEPERKKSLMERMNDKAKQNIAKSLGANGGAFQLPMD